MFVAAQAGGRTQAVPGCACALSWRMGGCPRSSSQEPIVAARFASLPFRPMGASEFVEGVGGRSTFWDFKGDTTTISGTVSELPEKKT